MSGQQSQRMRKNVSPSGAVSAVGKQGPLRATVPLSLMHQTCSPTRCLNSNGGNNQKNSSPSNSPPGDAKAKTRHSPDNRISPPETQSPTPSGLRAEKSKTLTKAVGSSTFIRRTASVDTIYLLGQWQRDALYLSYCGRLMMDRATQTPEEFEETDRRLAQKKCSTASGETLEMKFIRQRLQRTNHSSRGPPNQRHSPVQGDHHAISSSAATFGGGATSPVLPSSASPHHQVAPPHAAANNNASATYSSFASAAANTTRALPIPIPDIPKPLIPRMRSSVEGLNQEIERIVLRQISSVEGPDVDRTLEPTPEGHRAPIADLFRSGQQTVDTQTPFDREDSSGSPNSRSHSISPAIPSSRPSSTEESKDSVSPDLEGTSKLATSPHINKFLAREPPDGCEKVKIAEETRIGACATDPHGGYSCPKPSMNFVLLPSQRSAFYPLCKNCVMATPNGDLPSNAPPPSTFN